MKTSCPKCGQRYELDDDLAGQPVACTKCGQEFIAKKPLPPAPPRVTMDMKVTKAPVKSPESLKKFKPPIISQIFYGFGLTSLIFSILYGGITIISCILGRLNEYTGALAIALIGSAIANYAIGCIIRYLAEIACNTRKN